MKNKIIRLEGTPNSTMEIYCVETNTINPSKEIRECGIVVLGKENLQLDFDLDEDELEELISYLTEMKDHINEYNNK